MQIAGHIGSAGAPWVAQGLKNVHAYAPFLVMGISNLIASVLMTRLPETKGQKTAEVIETTHTTALVTVGENMNDAKWKLPNDDEELAENCLSTYV